MVVAKRDEAAASPVDLSSLSFVFAELKLALIYVGAKWALLQNSDFDLTLENEPYHAIQGPYSITNLKARWLKFLPKVYLQLGKVYLQFYKHVIS